MLSEADQEAVGSPGRGREVGPSGPLRLWLGRLLVVLQVAFVLSPPVLVYVHAQRNRVNVLHLDDWAYVPLYEKAVEGTLTAHDFFGGYLEHRPAVARFIAITTTLATKGDVRAQPIVAFAAIALTWLGCGLLLRRALGAWGRWWPAWSLMGWVLFNPVQWQEFLWPSCHMDTLPFLFLTLSMLVLGREGWPLLLRAGLCAACAWTATYSFAAGLTLWVLVPLAVLWGYGFPTARARWCFVLAWTVPMAATLFLYFYHLKNEVEGPFAYGQGNEETMTHSVAAVLHDPMKGVRFLVSLLGANFARGLLGTRNRVALWFGWVVVSLFAGLLLMVWFGRKNRGVRVAVLPFVIVGLYGLSVAGMVAAGRAWASRDVGGSLNDRYACFAAAFLAGLVGLIAALRSFREPADWRSGEFAGADPAVPGRRLLGRAMPVLAGVLVGLLVANWLYGANMMEAWRHARMRAAVDLHFSRFLRLAQDRSGPAMNLRMAPERAEIMDRLGFLDPPLAKSLRLSDLNIKHGLLDKRLADITGVESHRDEFILAGYTLITPSGRQPDGVLITFDDGSGQGKQIVKVAYTDNFPTFWGSSTTKDLQYVLFDDNRFRVFGRWSVVVPRESLPKGRLKLEAWGLNFSDLSVREVDGQAWVEN